MAAHVLCNRELRQYAFIDGDQARSNTDITYVTEKGDIISHIISHEIDVLKYIKKLEVEGWERLK